jgi:hypothetical protein
MKLAQTELSKTPAILGGAQNWQPQGWSKASELEAQVKLLDCHHFTKMPLFSTAYKSQNLDLIRANDELWKFDWKIPRSCVRFRYTYIASRTSTRIPKKPKQQDSLHPRAGA